MTGKSPRALQDPRADPPNGRVGHRQTRPRHGRRQPGTPRFLLRYACREIRRRLRQALLIALGLGVGVGLVMTVSAASAGVGGAQAAVLRCLYGIGTDLTVTEPARHSGAIQDPSALLPGDLGPMPTASVASISRLPHIAYVAGGLQLTELKRPAGGLPVSTTVDGADLAHPGQGPLAAGTIVSGRGFAPADGASDVAVADSDYAAANRLSAGSAITVAGTRFKITGIVRQPESSGSADIYLPLARAQELAQAPDGKRLAGQVNVIYVAADSATHVADVQTEISRLLPSVNVTSASDLARSVTGSLQSAASLIDDLGRWVAVAALIAAFAVASLLTIAAVTRRAREFGTLKALGWTATRVTGQIIGESAAIGVIGAAMGVAAGFAGAALVTGLAPTLSATVPRSNDFGDTTTVTVHIAAHVGPAVIVAAVLLAVGGAVLAGCLGAWRAARLQPADAFAQIG
jgi:putative ABC transport system permease protein